MASDQPGGQDPLQSIRRRLRKLEGKSDDIELVVAELKGMVEADQSVLAELKTVLAEDQRTLHELRGTVEQVESRLGKLEEEEEEVPDVEELRRQAEERVERWRQRWKALLPPIGELIEALDRVPRVESRPRNPLDPPDQQLVKEGNLADTLSQQTLAARELLEGQLLRLSSLDTAIANAANAGDAKQLAYILRSIDPTGEAIEARLHASAAGFSAQAAVALGPAASVELKTVVHEIYDLEQAL